MNISTGLMKLFLLSILIVSFVSADDEGLYKCYWTDNCDATCRDDEYIAAESTLMLCNSGSKRCSSRENSRRVNKLCCHIPRHLFRQTTNYQLGQSPITTVACDYLGGNLCHNQQQQPGSMMASTNIQPGQQNMALDCRWSEECGKPCQIGEFIAAEGHRLPALSQGGSERFCHHTEGQYRYCCKGPRIIWTSQNNSNLTK